MTIPLHAMERGRSTVFAPAGTPPRLVERLNREITELAGSSELKAIFEPDVLLPVAMTPAAFFTRIQQELAQWKQIVADRKIVAEQSVAAEYVGGAYR